MMSVSVAGTPKNRCRTTIAERMVETLAELPFIGNQVGLFRAQPGRPKRRMKLKGSQDRCVLVEIRAPGPFGQSFWIMDRIINVGNSAPTIPPDDRQASRSCIG